MRKGFGVAAVPNPWPRGSAALPDTVGTRCSASSSWQAEGLPYKGLRIKTDVSVASGRRVHPHHEN